MTFPSSLAFFDHLMNEGALDEAALVAFLAKSTSDEGLHLDFKSGQELDKPKDRRNFTVRQYVAAFANSEGGVLVIGVGDDKQPEPITTSQEGKVGGDLTGWAARCVSELIGYLGLPPRLSVIDVAGGKVLLIAVPRAASLVPVIKDGKQAYFFRVEDEAREVYPHLVSDLLLGRRSSPTLQVVANNWRGENASHVSVHQVADEDPPEQRSQTLVVFGGPLTITNDSLVTAESVAAGIVGLSAKNRTQEPDPPMPNDLRARLEVLPPDNRTRHPYGLRHTHLYFNAAQPGERPRSSATLKPFASEPASMNVHWRLEDRGTRPDLCAVMALYLVPEGCEPLWFEVIAAVYDVPAAQMMARPVVVHFRRVVGRRPRVGVVLAGEAPA